MAPRLMSSYQVRRPGPARRAHVGLAAAARRRGGREPDDDPPRFRGVGGCRPLRRDRGAHSTGSTSRSPRSWAARAKLHLTGDELPSSAQVVGPSTFWSIVPKRPLWGSHRFVLRSSLPLGTEREFVHPEVAPLGWGAVDAYVGIVNATGQPLAAEDATGLQRLSVSSHFRAGSSPVTAVRRRGRSGSSSVRGRCASSCRRQRPDRPIRATTPPGCRWPTSA